MLRFLWTHRDPCISIPSFLSMMSHSRTMFSNDVSLKQVADHWVRKSTFILEKGISYRNTQPQEKFLDIKFEDLVSDSGKILENIYGGIDEELMKEFRSAEQANPPQKYGTHSYSLEDFGLTKEDINNRIPLYQQFIQHPTPNIQHHD